MKNRTKKERIEGVQNVLEAYRRFTMETISYGDDWIMPDGDFRYRPRWYSRIEIGFWRFMLSWVAPLYLKIAFGAKVVGKENLRQLKGKGAITLCNHINYLDTLFVRQAAGHFGTFHTIAPWNNKKGVGGHIIRHGGCWPMSNNLAAMRNFSHEMERQLKRGKKINFYPEHAMWWNYPKPRPMMIGAFRYAVKFDVPVLPIFCTFDKSKRGGIKRLRIHILPAVFPDREAPIAMRSNLMREQAELEWKQCYEQAYGKPLVYLDKNDVRLMYEK